MTRHESKLVEHITGAVVTHHDGGAAVRWYVDRTALRRSNSLELGPGERRLLRLPVDALLYKLRDAPAGVDLAQVAVTLTTLSNWAG